MTPYKIRVYETLRRLFNQNLEYIPTRRIVRELGANYRRTYRALLDLESDGVIQRQSRKPYQAGGWRPTILGSCVYGALLRSFRLSHEFVQTDTIAKQLNQNPRVIRGELAQLETAYIVTRHNQRGGWQPVRQYQPTAGQQILVLLENLLDHQQPIHTNQIAQHLSITPRHARRLLSQYESQGILTRTGPRGSWQLPSQRNPSLMMESH